MPDLSHLNSLTRRVHLSCPKPSYVRLAAMTPDHADDVEQCRGCPKAHRLGRPCSKIGVAGGGNTSIRIPGGFVKETLGIWSASPLSPPTSVPFPFDGNDFILLIF